jgi:tRNA 2-selenouridine synthase
MSATPNAATVTVTAFDIEHYPDIIDARSEGEYAEDFIPGAVSHPVLNNAERARVGTLNKVASAFEAKRMGAALVSRNIANMLEQHFADKPRDWAPLIYCWRGGKRSRSLTLVLREIGFKQSLSGASCSGVNRAAKTIQLRHHLRLHRHR